MENILKNRCADDEYKLEKYQLLQLLKKEAEKKLKSVSLYFSHFSSHDISHSLNIINSISMLLNKKQLDSLSTSDIFVFLTVCYYHDIGMAITFEQIEKIIDSDEWRKKLEGYSKSEIEEIAVISERLLSYSDSKYNKDYKVLDIYKDVITIIETEFRKKHGQRSANYIRENDLIKTLFELRLNNIVAQICEVHEKDVNEINKLSPKENGSFKDYVHPRLIGYLLCLGDLLDMDTNRFDKYFLESTTPMTHISEIHKKKHESIKSLLYEDGLINIISDCDDQETYRCMIEWVDWIKKVCDFGVTYWRDLSPKDFGTAPILGKREILLKGQTKWSKYALIKPSISTEKALDLLSGLGIYKNKFLFVREIIQNAVDATLIRVFQDYKNSNTNEDILKWLCNNTNHIDNYKIEGEVSLVKNKLCFTLKDSGIGISEEELDRIIQFKGKSENLKSIIKEMPEWLRPSGCFNIGLQSIFQVAKSFSIITKTIDEKPKEITFEKVKGDKGYINVKDCKYNSVCGSIIKILFDENFFDRNDFSVSDYVFETTPKSRLIYESLVNSISNKKFMLPFKRQEQQKYDYIPVIINDKTNYYNNNVILEYKNIFKENYLNNDNNYEIILKDSCIEYHSFDLENNCIFKANLCDKTQEYESDYIYGSSKDCRFSFRYGKNVFYRNVYVCVESLNEFVTGIGKVSDYIDYSINLLSDNADQIMSLSRNSVRDNYRQILLKKILNNIDLMIKRIIDYFIDNKVKIKIKALLLLLLQEAKRINYKYDEFYKEFINVIKTIKIGNYFQYIFKDIEDENNIGVEKKYNYNQIKNKVLCFVKKISSNPIENSNVKKIFNDISKSKIYLSTNGKCINWHLLNHYVKKEYLAIAGNHLYLVFEAKVFDNYSIIERDDFIKYIEFVYLVFSNLRCIKPDNNYSNLQTVNVSYSYKFSDYKIIEMRLDDQIKKILQKELREKGFIENPEEYLDKIFISKIFEDNLNYISKIRTKEDTLLNRKNIEKEYKELWENRLNLLKNQQMWNFVKLENIQNLYKAIFDNELGDKGYYLVW